ncbi:MAG: hypothetical protein LJE91_08450 [Gammaproteobacteria bacterium]|jgi:hypothetical protein|nr:hypothetical protein [Gammaproteobacteria bacterium]
MYKIVATIAGAAPMSTAIAADMANTDEAKTMSEKAQGVVNSMGGEKAFAAFNDPGRSSS